MTANPVIEKLGRRLRLGVLGGGPGSVIGEVHRTGARLDDRYEVVGGVLSSNPERSRAAGRALGWAPERAYGDVDEMLAAETARPDGVDVVAIMTPNDSHYPLACRWLDAGRDVICDKPLTTRLEDARDLVARARAARAERAASAELASYTARTEGHIYFFLDPDGTDIDPRTFDPLDAGFDALKRSGKHPAAQKLRLALSIGGVDISGKPGGLTSAVHTGEDIAHTARALREAIRMLRAEGEL